MAETLNATAANIISSLGIKGATVRENLAGFVPVLDESGKINANLIPSDYADIAATPLSNVAYVDPYTSVSEYTDDGTRRRSGSVISPFKSISEAIANFSPTADAKNASCLALMLAPGTYIDTSISFNPVKFSPKYLFIIGTGECIFGATTFSFDGLDAKGTNRPAVFVQNVRMQESFSESSPRPRTGRNFRRSSRNTAPPCRFRRHGGCVSVTSIPECPCRWECRPVWKSGAKECGLHGDPVSGR